MISFIAQQLKLLIQDKWTWILLYAVSLFFGLLVAIPFYMNAKEVGGASMEVDRLISGFDYSSFFDFMRTSDKVFRPQYIATAVLGLLYLVLHIFFAGGVIDRAEHLNEKFSLSRFMSQSWKTFGKYLAAFGIMLLVAICFFSANGLFYFVATLLADSGDERSLIFWLSIPTLILVLSISFILAVQDYTKVLLYKYEHLGVGSAFSKAFGFVFNNPKTLLNLWILIAFAFLLFAIYLGLDSLIGMRGMFTIALFFVIQQVVSFTRIFLRFAHLRVAAQYLHIKPIHIPEPKILEEIEVDDEIAPAEENEKDDQ